VRRPRLPRVTIHSGIPGLPPGNPGDLLLYLMYLLDRYAEAMTMSENDRPDEDKLREAAREEIEAMPAETAAGNVDADSDGPDAAFDDEAHSEA
jgi:hypothetical protein